MTQLHERLRTVAKHIQRIDAIAETENEAADDNGGNDRCKYLGDNRHGALNGILVLDGGSLGCVLAHALDSGDLGKLRIVGFDVVTNDDLELPSLRKAALGIWKRLDSRHVGLRFIVEHEPHARHTVAHGGNIVLASHQLEQLGRVVRILAHAFLLLRYSIEP